MRRRLSCSAKFLEYVSCSDAAIGFCARHADSLATKRPNALGNALGGSIAEASQSGVDWNNAPDQSDAETARLNTYQAAAVAANDGGYFPSRSLQTGQTFSDVYGPVNSFDPTADASGSRLNLSFGDADLARVSEQSWLNELAARLRRETADIQGLISTDRALQNMSDLAEAYRASGMTGATGDPLTIESSVLAGSGLKPPSEGFFFGLSGGQRSALDGTPATFAENAGLFTRGLLTGPVTSAIGLASEIGHQYSDLYSLVTGSGSSVPSSALLTSLQREGVGGTLLNMGESVLSAPSKPIFDLLEGRYQQAGEGLPGTLAAGVGIFGKLRGLKLGEGSGTTFIDFSTVDDVAPGLYRADPRQLRFMQPTVSPNYSTGGHTIASTAEDLRLGRVTPEQLGDPLRVVMIEGKPFSFDNRRVLSYNLADVSDAPIQVMGLDDPVFARGVRARFNPIEGEGLRVVVAPSSERNSVMADLYRLGMIQRPK